MDRAAAQDITDGPAARGTVRAFAALAAGMTLLLAAALALILPVRGAALGTFVLAAVAGLAMHGMTRTYRHPRLGLCNAVTLVRAALTAGLAAALAAPGVPAWGLVAVAATALALDGVDGWLARREGLQSAFGARFDMEVDALLALVLALLALTLAKAGPWVLLLGGLRYGFVAASLALPWLGAALPPRAARKTVCVIQIATLTALLAPPVVPPLSLALAAMATVLLVASFAVDVLWLWHRR
ncbi:MAG: CDP-alcohol phosphatidyltransferase family protein [Gemmobacter sp.]